LAEAEPFLTLLSRILQGSFTLGPPIFSRSATRTFTQEDLDASSFEDVHLEMHKDPASDVQGIVSDSENRESTSGVEEETPLDNAGHDGLMFSLVCSLRVKLECERVQRLNLCLFACVDACYVQLYVCMYAYVCTCMSVFMDLCSVSDIR